MKPGIRFPFAFWIAELARVQECAIQVVVFRGVIFSSRQGSLVLTFMSTLHSPRRLKKLAVIFGTFGAWAPQRRRTPRTISLDRPQAARESSLA